MAAKQGARLLGRCLPFFPGKSIPNASRIQIRKLDLDENLNMVRAIFLLCCVLKTRLIKL